MRIAALVLLIFLVSFGFGFNRLLANEQSAEPEDVYSWDFGQVQQGEVLEHAFEVKNESAVKLQITDIHTSCGCATSEVDKKQILPGDSVQIQLKFDTTGYAGLIKQFAYIHTDQPDRPIIKLSIKADIRN